MCCLGMAARAVSRTFLSILSIHDVVATILTVPDHVFLLDGMAMYGNVLPDSK